MWRMNKTDTSAGWRWSSILLLVTAFLIYSSTGVFSKLASAEEFLSMGYLLRFGLVILALGVYAVLWQIILKRFPLSRAYLYKSMTVIFSLAFAFFFFGEQITVQNILGAVLIICGIIVNSTGRNV